MDVTTRDDVETMCLGHGEHRSSYRLCETTTEKWRHAVEANFSADHFYLQQNAAKPCQASLVADQITCLRRLHNTFTQPTLKRVDMRTTNHQ